MTAPLPENWQEKDSFECYGLGLEVIRRELEISRKALAAIAEPFPIGIFSLAVEDEVAIDIYSELNRIRDIAKSALAAIQAVRRGDG